jgi:hypothetical protein
MPDSCDIFCIRSDSIRISSVAAFRAFAGITMPESGSVIVDSQFSSSV